MPARSRPLRPELSPRHLLGALLRELREAAGLSQRELGDKVFCSGHLIGRIEKAERWPHAELVHRCDELLSAEGKLVAVLPHLERQRREVSGNRAAGKDESVGGPRHSPEGPVNNWQGDGGPEHRGLLSTVAVAVQVDGMEVLMQLDRRTLLNAGLVSFVATLGLDPVAQGLTDPIVGMGRPLPLTFTSTAHLDEVLAHLADQWHSLVKTDNLLGPRYAIGGVLQQLTVVEALLRATRAGMRRQVLRLGAQYAESAAWLYEESAAPALARAWTDRAMQWAYEADDQVMTAWTMYRRSQQAAELRDAAEAIGLASAARRDERQLSSATRAATRVQEAAGYWLDGDEHVAQGLLDEAHEWAASDNAGDAREGHGSFCTPAYIELKRAEGWVTMGRPRNAIAGFAEWLPRLPAVYQRDRAVALTWQANAHLADNGPEEAAAAAHGALPIARSCGSQRILKRIDSIGVSLREHRRLPAVDAFLADLGSQG